MIFSYQPILEKMIDFYSTPREVNGRFFHGYLPMIQTADKKDLKLPLVYFNPMAREHVLAKLIELRDLHFEERMEVLCKECSTGGDTLQTYFNLADDIGGMWTTRESTHAMSLQIKPYLKRNFCVILFYASEVITEAVIKERVKFYTNHYNSW